MRRFLLTSVPLRANVPCPLNVRTLFAVAQRHPGFRIHLLRTSSKEVYYLFRRYLETGSRQS